jgi:hypothetical protein
MGLDMYLRASEYISRNDWGRDENGDILDTPNETFKAIVEAFEMQDVIDKTGFAGISVDFPMGYWRKANQIHNWFVENVQDGEDNCGSYYVTREQLEELKELCIQAIANPTDAEALLPTGSGFFFGSTEYDEYYFGDLNDTIGIINRCLESKFDGFEYQSSW